MRICDAQGSVVARYNYDAWGKCRVYTSNRVGITEHSGYNNYRNYLFRGGHLKTYYDKVIEIKKKPLMFLGTISLTKLKSFMDGYMNCLYEITGKYDLGKFQGFREWIEYRYFHRRINRNWAQIICFFSDSEEKAFWEFYRLLEEYTTKSDRDEKID